MSIYPQEGTGLRTSRNLVADKLTQIRVLISVIPNISPSYGAALAFGVYAALRLLSFVGPRLRILRRGARLKCKCWRLCYLMLVICVCKAASVQCCQELLSDGKVFRLPDGGPGYVEVGIYWASLIVFSNFCFGCG